MYVCMYVCEGYEGHLISSPDLPLSILAKIVVLYVSPSHNSEVHLS